MQITLEQIFKARFSGDPALLAQLDELERMYELQTHVSMATLNLTIAEANLSMAQIEARFHEEDKLYTETLDLLQQLLARRIP